MKMWHLYGWPTQLALAFPLPAVGYPLAFSGSPMGVRVSGLGDLFLRGV